MTKQTKPQPKPKGEKMEATGIVSKLLKAGKDKEAEKKKAEKPQPTTEEIIAATVKACMASQADSPMKMLRSFGRLVLSGLACFAVFVVFLAAIAAFA